MFENELFDEILDGWKEILNGKYDKVFEDYPNIKNIYYFFILRESYNFHLLGLKLKRVTNGFEPS